MDQIMDWKNHLTIKPRPRATISVAKSLSPYLEQIKGRVGFHFGTTNLLINQVEDMAPDHFLVQFDNENHKFSIDIEKDEGNKT